MPTQVTVSHQGVIDIVKPTLERVKTGNVPNVSHILDVFASSREQVPVGGAAEEDFTRLGRKIQGKLRLQHFVNVVTVVRPLILGSRGTRWDEIQLNRYCSVLQ